MGKPVASAGGNDAYVETVLRLVEAIPAGQVSTYGDLAQIAGVGGPRQVGRVLAEVGATVPWWRVVRADGRPARGLAEPALTKLRAEGVTFRGVDQDRVDMSRSRWVGGIDPIRDIDPTRGINPADGVDRVRAPGDIAESPELSIRRQFAADRFLTEGPGISTRHSFSFGQHYDPDNIGFGRLLAQNDERLLSGRGYDDHPHRDTEIVTWVLAGSLLHEDSTGYRGIVERGLVQRLSAGSGVIHAERNDAYRIDPDRPLVPVRFVQCWVRPDRFGGSPSYQQGEIPATALSSDWVPVAAGAESDAAISIASIGTTLWVTRLARGQFRLLPEGALAQVLVATGRVDVERVGLLAEGDTLAITGRAALRVTGLDDAELLVWTMPDR